MKIDRRQFLQLTALGGGAVFASSLVRGADSAAQAAKHDDFYFVQLSDSHWGFTGPAINPDARGTLPKAVAAVNALDEKPDFVMFTGDLTHTTDNPEERRKRMAEFKDIVSKLDVKTVHFIVVDNVSDPAARIGDDQLEWLAADLKKQPNDARIVVFTHRPLFDLAPQWDWATRDGAKAIDLLMPYPNVTVFYGHIHQ